MRKGLLGVIFTVLLFPSLGFGAFTHYKSYTIASGQISGSIGNYALLIRETDNDFRTTGNGGCVANANGYDIRPYADTGASTALDYQLVAGTYSASTGIFEMHVRVSSAAVGSVIYLFCGDSALTTDGSSTGTWNSNYLGVYHLTTDSPVTLTDSTSNGLNLSNGGNDGNATSITGQLGAGAGLASSGSFNGRGIGTGTTSAFGDRTVEGWVRFPSFMAVGGDGSPVLAIRHTADTYPHNVTIIYILDNDTLKAGGYNGSTRADTDASSALSTNTWYYVAATQSSNTLSLYLNGSLVDDVSYSPSFGSENLHFFANATGGGVSGAFWSGYIDLQVDEFRVSNTVRTAAYFAAVYNNQSNPANFTDKGTLTSLGGGGSITGVQSKAFTAGGVNDSVIDVAFDTNNTAGNFIFAVISYCSTTACNNDGTSFTKTITDTRGNTYTQTNCSDDDSANHVVSCGYYARNIGAGANTVTSTLTDMGGLEAWYHTIIVMEFSGVSTASDVLDQVNKNIGTSADGSVSTSSSTTQANELVVGFLVGPSGSATVGSGYTLISNTGHLTAEYKVVSSTGTQTATWVHSSERWKANINTFKGASGGGAGGTGAPLILRLGL